MFNLGFIPWVIASTNLGKILSGSGTVYSFNIKTVDSQVIHFLYG